MLRELWNRPQPKHHKGQNRLGRLLPKRTREGRRKHLRTLNNHVCITLGIEGLYTRAYSPQGRNGLLSRELTLRSNQRNQDARVELKRTRRITFSRHPPENVRCSKGHRG